MNVINRQILTLDEFTIQSLRQFPHATGELSTLLRDIGLAAKRINVEVNKAGLVDILGETGDINVQGEEVKKLDEFANHQFMGVLQRGVSCAGIASEEMDDFVPFDDEVSMNSKYVCLFDPLDGSSNIDVNVSIGTIFSVLRCPEGVTPDEQAFLQPGSQQVAAGFAVYFHNFSTFLAKPGIYLEDLFVRSEYRGIGIGQALLERHLALRAEVAVVHQGVALGAFEAPAEGRVLDPGGALLKVLRLDRQQVAARVDRHDGDARLDRPPHRRRDLRARQRQHERVGLRRDGLHDGRLLLAADASRFRRGRAPEFVLSLRRLADRANGAHRIARLALVYAEESVDTLSLRLTHQLSARVPLMHT